ncbi:hypothetical protein PIB30_013288 [Stylosanthes scabra]|uniref:Uncharacterized protein n=1 Tax=Stylosanthes scabra TaxID=79078 RepID=A0ABU6S6T3_9FABA|nr:hypothetical protein [Stylosanthes scabra]
MAALASSAFSSRCFSNTGIFRMELRRCDACPIQEALLKVGKQNPDTKFGEHYFVHPQPMRPRRMIQVHITNPFTSTRRLHPEPPIGKGSTALTAVEPPQPLRPVAHFRDSAPFNSLDRGRKTPK